MESWYIRDGRKTKVAKIQNKHPSISLLFYFPVLVPIPLFLLQTGRVAVVCTADTSSPETAGPEEPSLLRKDVVPSHCPYSSPFNGEMFHKKKCLCCMNVCIDCV